MSVMQKSALTYARLAFTQPCCYNLRGFTGYGIPERPDCSKRDKDGFRILKIPGLHYDETAARADFRAQRAEEQERMVHREKNMPVDQDWTNVWPTAAAFKPSSVPLPIRQGFIKNQSENDGIVPDKHQNLELMKIQNFLHLTPPHIMKHCSALRKFCTPWPKGLNKKKIKKDFPVSVTTRQYVYSSPTLRDPRANKVKMEFKLDSLDLDDHALDKMIRLLGERYDKGTNMVTLEVNSAPVKQQNLEYAKYLLTALYYESWKIEEWESERTWADNVTYDWDQSEAKKKTSHLLAKISDTAGEESKKDEGLIEEYGEAVTKLHNQGENDATLQDYKAAVLKMLKLKPQTSESTS